MPARSHQEPHDRERLREIARLRSEAHTALELAVVALAPSELLFRLASSAGVLDALVELPSESPPVTTFMPGVVVHARAALAEWQDWQRAHLEQKMPRG